MDYCSGQRWICGKHRKLCREGLWRHSSKQLEVHSRMAALHWYNTEGPSMASPQPSCSSVHKSTRKTKTTAKTQSKVEVLCSDSRLSCPQDALHCQPVGPGTQANEKLALKIKEQKHEDHPSLPRKRKWTEESYIYVLCSQMQQCVKYSALFLFLCMCVYKRAHMNSPAGGWGSSAN